MSTAVWDPDTILQITDPAGRGMFCFGLVRPRFDSRCRSRCRWDVPRARYIAILSMLRAISTKLPHDVTNSELRRIARLGLCEYHDDQEDEVVAKWKNILGCLEGINETVLSVQLGAERAMVKVQKEENCRLSAENSRLSTLLKRAEEEHERCTNQESNLTAECKKLHKHNAALQAHVNSEKDKYKDLQAREQSATLELMATTTQLREVQSVNEGLKNDKKTLQSEIDILKEEMKRLNDNNTDISSQLAASAASLETMTKKVSAAHEENMQLRDELTTATGELMELRTKINQLSTPVWYKVIQWIQQKLSGLKYPLKPTKRVSDEEEGVALAQTGAFRDVGLA